MFQDKLDGGFDDNVVEKTFHNAPCAILRVCVEIRIYSGEGAQPVANEVAAHQANFADQFV